MQVSRETSARDLLAPAVFGSALPQAQKFAEVLATAGVQRGLIGPRETERLWDRHLLNCAVVADGLPAQGSVYDVGSGAGLPGMVLALMRPDLDFYLVESLQRRCDFLRETVDMLEVRNVTVLRDRAEQLSGQVADVVTARAVAPLPRLARWCVPLLRSDGALLAVKGARAEAELAEAEPELARLGARGWEIVTFGEGTVPEPTTVVRVLAAAHDQPSRTVAQEEQPSRVAAQEEQPSRVAAQEEQPSRVAAQEIADEPPNPEIRRPARR